MVTREDESSFDASEAELFEAVGHPNRIKIIQALDQGGMGFAELKKEVGMESSGHLSFHLGKLQNLVAINADGQYALTGEGREALRMIRTVREDGVGKARRNRSLRGRSLVALLLIMLVALAMVAAVQEVEIANLTAKPPGTVSLNGHNFWYSTIPLSALPLNANTSVLFDGVNFTLIPGQLGTIVPLNSSGGFVLTRATLVNLTSGQIGRTVTFRFVPSPEVLVKFPDGKTEHGSLVPFVTPSESTFVVFGPQWRWFSSHVNPQAAILENGTEITLFVSASR